MKNTSLHLFIRETKTVLGICFLIYLFIRVNSAGYSLLPYQDNQAFYSFILLVSILILSLSEVFVTRSNRIRFSHFDIITIIYVLSVTIYIIVDKFHVNREWLMGQVYFIVLYIAFRQLDKSFYKYSLFLFPVFIFVQFYISIKGSDNYFFLCEHLGKVTGVFLNSSLWGCFVGIALLVVVGLLYTTKRKLFFLPLLTIVIGLIFLLYESNSRTAWIATSIGVVVLLQSNYKIKPLLLFALITLFLVSLGFLYNYKKNSSEGRLVIWRVSMQMIKDKPILGHGERGFAKSYMDYQAVYFNKNNPNSASASLADETHYTFNDYLRLVIEYGIVGGLFCAILIWGQIRTVWCGRFEEEKRCGIVKVCLLAMGVFGLFSYPFQTFHLIVLFICLISFLAQHDRDCNIKKFIFTKRSVSILLIFVVALGGYSCYLHKYSSDFSKWITFLSDKSQCTHKQFSELHTTLNDNAYFGFTYGKFLNYSKDYVSATEVLEQSYSNFNSYATLMELAQCYLSLENDVAAEKCLKKACRMIPHKFMPEFLLLKFYYNNKDYTKAYFSANKILAKPIKRRTATLSRILDETTLMLKNLGTRVYVQNNY